MVPETNMTPSRIASMVVMYREVCSRSPASVVRSIGSGLQLQQMLGDDLGGGVGDLVDQLPIAQKDHAVGVGGGDRAVGDHDDGLVHLLGRLLHDGQDLRALPVVHVAR